MAKRRTAKHEKFFNIRLRFRDGSSAFYNALGPSGGIAGANVANRNCRATLDS